MKTHLFVVLAALLLCAVIISCSDDENEVLDAGGSDALELGDIEPGMTAGEVEKMFGSPFRIRTVGTATYLYYVEHPEDSWAKEDDKYTFVKIIDGIVAETYDFMGFAREVAVPGSVTLGELYPLLSGLSGYRESAGFGIPVAGTPVPYSFSEDFVSGLQGVRIHFRVSEYGEDGLINITSGVVVSIENCDREPGTGDCLD